MLIEKDIQKILSLLAGSEHMQVAFAGSDILIRFVEDASKLSLTTTVYYGGNYIPTSVRRCLSHKSPVFQSSIPTYLTVDEQQFQINLHYVGSTPQLTYSNFKDLLEEFGSAADEWRHYLDENDKNDLIYVRVK